MMMRYQARMHPTLDILCDTLGRVFLPATKFSKAHWTFGYKRKDGYLQVNINGNTYRVARLICETFHGLAPEDRPTCDHINRDRELNIPFNLRWANYRQQNNNRQVCYDSLKKYGVRSVEDRNAYYKVYMAAYYAKNAKYVGQCRALCREYKARQHALGRRYRRCPDGSRQWLTDEEFFKKFGYWPKK